jgi:hypothetical protein
LYDVTARRQTILGFRKIISIMSSSIDRTELQIRLIICS